MVHVIECQIYVTHKCEHSSLLFVPLIHKGGHQPGARAPERHQAARGSPPRYSRTPRTGACPGPREGLAQPRQHDGRHDAVRDGRHRLRGDGARVGRHPGESKVGRRGFHFATDGEVYTLHCLVRSIDIWSREVHSIRGYRRAPWPVLCFLNLKNLT